MLECINACTIPNHTTLFFEGTCTQCSNQQVLHEFDFFIDVVEDLTAGFSCLVDVLFFCFILCEKWTFVINLIFLFNILEYCMCCQSVVIAYSAYCIITSIKLSVINFMSRKILKDKMLCQYNIVVDEFIIE